MRNVKVFARKLCSYLELLKSYLTLNAKLPMPKYYILTLGAIAPGVSALVPISLESPFNADIKALYT